MSFSKMIAGAFAIFFIVILYVIIYYALKIMYKDVKNGGKKKRPAAMSRGNYGLEIISSGSAKDLKDGSIIPLRSDVTIGRKSDNSIVVMDQHVSGHHAKILVRSNGLFLEDLNSTNGTFINDNKIRGKAKLSNKDRIKIGTAIFKILS